MWRDLDNVCIELIPRMFEENINAIDKFRRTLLMLAAKKSMIAVSLEFIKLLPPEMIIRADNNGNMAASYYADMYKAFAEVRELLQEKQQNLLKNLASFLNKTFLSNNGLDNFFKIAYATKFYKKVKVNKELLASYLQEQNNNPESIKYYLIYCRLVEQIVYTLLLSKIALSFYQGFASSHLSK
ncbi:hypothetical protein ACE5D9_05415 [Rickettsia sp. 2024-CO-Wats]|uniref:hypothetical protein n=1 Tax=unclassified Rickettsia TaxID=114295 RepID=UPI00370D97E9